MELESSKHMLRTQSSELSLSRTKHEFPFEFRKRIKFPFLSHFEKGNYALKKECFRFRRNNHITHTHTEFLSLLLYDIFVWFFSAWTGRTTLTASLDMLNDYQALNKLCFFFNLFLLLLLPFNNLFHIYNKPFCSLSTPLPNEFMVLSPRPWG